MRDSNAEMSTGHRRLTAASERTSAETKKAAEAAGERVRGSTGSARLVRGEDIAATASVEMRRLFAEVGITDSDIRQGRALRGKLASP